MICTSLLCPEACISEVQGAKVEPRDLTCTTSIRSYSRSGRSPLRTACHPSGCRTPSRARSSRTRPSGAMYASSPHEMSGQKYRRWTARMHSTRPESARRRSRRPSGRRSHPRNRPRRQAGGLCRLRCAACASKKPMKAGLLGLLLECRCPVSSLCTFSPWKPNLPPKLPIGCPAVFAFLHGLSSPCLLELSAARRSKLLVHL